ncbi:PepSY domain-containing protein [Micromonospora sp. WMMA1998]|uniref:PepSY domain-containing protein n=1 Tax=Micromonospora sp. WMMA1998 TaxID=3015167 RepID=UPI00248B8A42|nr:PepSY domain-containing protein [Micromonospora sp. WMMA1998]WBC14273.1 PepSY domain-containing protein [Micromonospora sp. WMMA1998]
MRRTSLVLAAAGGVAVLAVAGAALGVTAAERSGGPTAPAAVTVEDNPTRPGADDTTGTGASGEDNPERQGVDDDATAGQGAVGGDDPARRGVDDDATGAATGGAVSRQRAAEVALARTGGGRVIEVEAETEHGRPAWSVKVDRDGWRHEVKVDRGTGAVLEVERERAGADDQSRDDSRGRDDDGSRDDSRVWDDDGGRDDSRGRDDRHDDHGDDD